MAKPTVGHLDPYYLSLMDDMQQMLRSLFRTQNQMTLAVSGTGSAGMEATVVNLIEPGDSMVVCVNGVFGGRMADVAGRAGAKVTRSIVLGARSFDRPISRRRWPTAKPKVVGIVMAETSTGAWQPIEEIANLVHDAGALLLVDAVTSLGGVPVEVDRWDIDAIYSGTQKCLSCPPGLAPVSFSQRAMDVVLNRKTKVQSWYLDVSMLAKYWGEERVYHHTAPINMTYGLHEALRIVLEEGLEACFARHRANHLALKAGLAAMGIGYAAHEGHQLPMLNAVQIPGRRRRRRGPRAIAEPLRHRDRRGPGRLQGQGLAHRADGLRLAAGQRAVVPRGAGANSGRAGLQVRSRRLDRRRHGQLFARGEGRKTTCWRRGRGGNGRYQWPI